MLLIEGIDVYYGAMPALRQVSLKVPEGEIVSLVGSNGAGKTTTLMTVSGILRPVSGRIIYHEQALEKLAPRRIVRMGIAHIPEGRQLFPSLTVLENLKMGARFPKAKQAYDQTLEWIFSLFPTLSKRKEQKAQTLSGGEQQMLAIGRGLVSLPTLLMLDEPSLGLSPLLVSKVFEIIGEINRQGTTVLLVEQNVYHSLNISNTGYVLENGEIKFSGSGKELLSDDRVRQAYLGL